MSTPHRPSLKAVPPEILLHIFDFAVPRSSSTTRSCDKCTTSVALSHQSQRHSMRLVCRHWRDLLGPPSEFVCRNITKIVQLTRYLKEGEEKGEGELVRGRRVRSLVLLLREPSHGRRRTCVLGTTLGELLVLCPGLRALTAGGVRMDHPDPTWDGWKGGPRLLRVEAVLTAAKVCPELESLAVLGRNTSLGEEFLLETLPSWPRLQSLTVSQILPSSTHSHSLPSPSLPLPQLQHLALTLASHLATTSHAPILEALSHKGALSSLDIQLDLSHPLPSSTTTIFSKCTKTVVLRIAPTCSVALHRSTAKARLTDLLSTLKTSVADRVLVELADQHTGLEDVDILKLLDGANKKRLVEIRRVVEDEEGNLWLRVAQFERGGGVSEGWNVVA
ncbi:hypothetical protein T439DRAFT_350698 [Meredithblackwellia eburnea MCA 4105]